MENNETKEVVSSEVVPNEEAKQEKPLSSNKCAAFFQKIWRWWLGVWGKFATKHPKLSKILYQVAMFWVFSMGVTVFQYIVMTFLPYAFGLELAGTEWQWPAIVCFEGSEYEFTFNLLGYAVQTSKETGEVIIGGGLGFFIAYELATFFAQVINFPLQRNITFKSHGNVWWQIMWYFIAWVVISLVCNGINSAWLGIAVHWGLPGPLYNILTTVITGGVSMVVFFFVFKIIFPEGEAKKKEN